MTNLTTPVIRNRYQLGKILGQGGLGTTYRAKDLKMKRWVAVKVVALRQMKDWKVLDLLERETQILQNLDHPAIPNYVDSFEIADEHRRDFYLVQALAPGGTLAQWVEKGWQPSRQEVVDVAQKILKILCYLQSYTPAIIHRDIKPQNILRDKKGNIYLVDFGSIQDTYRHTVTDGSTVVGTFGYMAPEQFRGQATPSTDLFGLGATLIFLLTGKDPADLPENNFQIDFRSHTNVDKFFGLWLDSLISPMLEKRLPTAQIALETLSKERPLLQQKTTAHHRLLIERTQTSLLLEVLPQGLQEKRFRGFTIASCVCTVMISLYIMLIIQSGGLIFFGKELVWLLLLAALGWFVSLRCLSLASVRTRLLLTRETLCFWQGLFLLPRGKKFHSFELRDSPLIDKAFAEIDSIRICTNSWIVSWLPSIHISNGRHVAKLSCGNSVYYFGHGLSAKEQKQMINELSHFINTETKLSRAHKLRLLGPAAKAPAT